MTNEDNDHHIEFPEGGFLPDDLQESLDKLNDVVSEYWDSHYEILSKGLQNFKEPSEYDPTQFSIDEETQYFAAEWLASLIKSEQESDRDTLQPYLPRLERGFEAYFEREDMLASFVFISVLDGLTAQLCKQQGIDPEGSDYYTSSQKHQALESAYKKLDHGLYGVESKKIIDQLEIFWKHRNAIMHGDPVAFFDENIATVALLFLIMTIYTFKKNR